VRLPWRRGSTIEVRARGRDNNFNLVRFLAAGLVLVSHSWPLTGTPGEPLERIAGFSLGHVGVDVFFVVSGFLVTGSLVARSSLADFARARALRIFPALVLSAFGTALVIGPLVTELPFGRYLASPDTWLYALQNSVTWPMGVRWWLPGVFLANPGGPAVNGALWSLPWELTMYVLLGMVGLWLLRERGPRSVERTRVVVMTVAIGAMVGHGVNEAFALTHRFEVVQALRLLALFFGAGSLQLLRGRVPLALGPLGGAILALVLGLRFGGAWLLLYPLALAYLVVWVALVPAGPIRNYNRIGDYSYGFYLWQFPIQQWVVLGSHQVRPLELILIAAPITLVLAALSWHLVEAPALALKRRAIGEVEARV
jgi:peptidoglycan/LPS O-acetylase OafA/YrhL